MVHQATRITYIILSIITEDYLWPHLANSVTPTRSEKLYVIFVVFPAKNICRVNSQLNLLIDDGLDYQSAYIPFWVFSALPQCSSIN